MRIFFIHQFYRTPEEGGGIRSWYVTRALQQAGHEVTVLAAEQIQNAKYESQGRKTRVRSTGFDEDDSLTKYKSEGDREEEILTTKCESKDASGFNDKDRLRSASDFKDQDRLRNASAIKVIRLPVGWSNSMSFWQRINAFFKFLYLARKESKKHEYDMVYAVSVPLTSGLLAIWTKKPFVFEVGDLWPDVPVQMKILRNPILKYFSYRLEKKIYKKAELIISLSKDIQRHIYRKWPYTANIVVENFSDSSFYKRKNSQRFSKQLESGYTLEGQLRNTNYEIQNIKASEINCTYVGTAGVANDLMQMVELTKLAEKKFPQIKFYMMISGKEEEIIKKAAPTNIHFVNYGNKQKVAELLAISDFNFVTYAQYSLLGTGSPNKFFDGLSAACITVINVKGWIEELIIKENAGLFWDVKDNKALLDEILRIHSDSERKNQMKKNALNLAEDFDKDKLCQTIFEQIGIRFGSLSPKVNK